MANSKKLFIEIISSSIKETDFVIVTKDFKLEEGDAVLNYKFGQLIKNRPSLKNHPHIEHVIVSVSEECGFKFKTTFNSLNRLNLVEIYSSSKFKQSHGQSSIPKEIENKIIDKIYDFNEIKEII